MKKIIHITISILLLTTYGYSQNGNIQTTTIKGRGNAMDTLITKKTELSFNKTYPNNYKRDEAVAQVLKPYLLQQIIAPTNLTHPLYLELVKEAKEKLPVAKAQLLNRMKVSSRIKENMAKINIYNEADLNLVTFMFIPLYYLSPNIIFFKNGENIAKYYNLGKGGLKYLMLRNNKPIGYLNYYNDSRAYVSDFFPMHLNDTESFNQIMKIGKTPIGLISHISDNEKNVGAGSLDMFGYIEQGHLILSYYEEGIKQNIATDGYVAPNPRFIKQYTLETVESFFSGTESSSTINSWLERSADNLKKRQEKQ